MLHDRRGCDHIDGLPFCYTDIEEIFLECQFSILPLELADLVSFGGILIEYPDIVDTETSDQYDSEYIGLSE